MSFLSASAVVLAIALPQLGLAHYWAFPLYPTSIPQPLLNLLILTAVSLYNAVYTQPFVLNLLLPDTPENKKARFRADWASAVVLWSSFSLLWVALLGRWPVPSPDVRSPQEHQDLVLNWRIPSVIIGAFGFLAINLGCLLEPDKPKTTEAVEADEVKVAQAQEGEDESAVKDAKM